ncbi:DUF86 domain-containing protein [Ottowia sp.]|uniref:HepT-like ribonuclease domain-containing protein n=1 Tax=Ottowia sp. TaxID=1898956 RepID=UPI0039E2223B
MPQPRDPRAYLWDVQEAARAIRNFTRGLDADAYAGNALVQAAVERKFEIIGEAPSQLSKQDAGMAARIPHAAQVVAFRNLLIHGYAAVHVRRVWEVVENDLPQLEASVARLQAEIYGRQRSGGETPREGDEA